MTMGYKRKVMGHLFWAYISKMPCIQLREPPLCLAKNGGGPATDDEDAGFSKHP